MEHDEGQATESKEEKQETALLIAGDHRLLRVLLDHLLENAVHYSPAPTPIEVGLGVRRHEAVLTSLKQQWRDMAADLEVPPSSGGWVEIWVKDEGMGMAPEQLSRIFERFYRVDRSLTRQVNGLGLGLTLCQYIVRLHGGLIWAESAPGLGSTFHVVLPCLLSEPAEQERVL
jgi:signal transduction histidine kinase